MKFSQKSARASLLYSALNREKSHLVEDILFPLMDSCVFHMSNPIENKRSLTVTEVFRQFSQLIGHGGQDLSSLHADVYTY